jgi:hypothetical protein
VSNLLQRLAQQANGSANFGVRAAARVRAAEPLSLARETLSMQAPRFEAPLLSSRLDHPVSRDSPTAELHSPLSPQSAEPGVPPLVPASTSPSAALPFVEPKVSRAEPRFPAPLLDLQRFDPTPAPRPVARIESTPATHQVEQTEVHVHIGRIEITAENALPAPGIKPPATRPSLTLGDYLAKRQRRSP